MALDFKTTPVSFNTSNNFDVGLKFTPNESISFDFLKDVENRRKQEDLIRFYDEERKKQANIYKDEKRKAEELEMIARMGEYDNGTEDYLYNLGESVGLDVDAVYGNLGEKDRDKIKTANTVKGVTSVLGTLLGGVKNFMGGMARSKHDSYRRKAYADKQRLTSLYKDYQFIGEDGGVFKNMTDAQAFTEDFKEQDDNNPNSNLEGGEYTKEESGNVKQVLGKSHKQGGVPVTLEENEKVLSDNLKIGKDLAHKLRDVFELRVFARDTYSEVLKKFEEKTGFKKLQKELEDIYKDIEKNEKIEDKATSEQNLTFLSEKIEDIEAKRLPIDNMKKSLFDFLWNQQEKSKGVHRGNKITEPLDETINSVDETPEYEDGGKFGSVGWYDNKYAKDSYHKQQKVSDINYGDITETNNERLLLYSKLFPSLFNKYFKKDSESNIELKEGKSVKDFQEDYNKTLGGVRDMLIADDTKNSSFVQGMYDKHSFLEGDENANHIRYTDNKKGEFTTSRGFYTKNIVSPDSLKKLNENGIYNFEYLKKIPIQELKEQYGLNDREVNFIQSTKSVPFIIGSYNKLKPIDFQDRPVVVDKKEEILDINRVPTSPHLDDDKGGNGSAEDFGVSSMLYIPSQGRRMPRGLEIPSLFQVEYDRVDRFKTDVEPLISEAGRNLKSSEDALNDTNDSVNKLLVGNLALSNMSQIGNTLQKVAEIDSRNAIETDRLNSKLEMSEDNFNIAEKKDYQDKTFTAVANTNLDIDNYFEARRQDRLKENLMRHQMYLMSDNSENFNVNSMGTVGFDKYSGNILTDPQGRKWVSTNKGLVKLDQIDKDTQERLVRLGISKKNSKSK